MLGSLVEGFEYWGLFVKVFEELKGNQGLLRKFIDQ